MNLGYWKGVALLLVVAGLTGCATPYVVPQGQPGELAQIRVQKIDKGVGELLIASIDDKKLHGEATALLPGQHALRIKKYPPAGMSMMFGLLGAWSMEMDSVSRDLSFTAEKNGSYTVHYSEDTGLPPKTVGIGSKSSIKRRFWIEDSKSGKTVVEKN